MNQEQRSFRKKLFLMVPSLGIGGAERMMLNLFNNLSLLNVFDVYLVVFHRSNNVYKEYDDFRSNFIFLDVKRVRYSLFKLIKLFYNEKPDVVLATLPVLTFWMALFRFLFPKKIFFVARESNIPSIIDHNFGSFIYNFFYKLLLAKFDGIICQSEDMYNDLVKNFGSPPSKMIVINNMVTPPELDNSFEIDNDDIRCDVVAVGRLENQKGFDRLIESTKFINNDIKIVILGTGSLHSELQKRINDCKSNVKLLGYKKNIVSYLKKAKVLALPSRYEGFPNILLESFSVGTPVVSFDILGGVNELVSNGVNGFIVPDDDIKLFGETIEKALNHNFDRTLIMDAVYSKFGSEKITLEYMKFLIKVSNKE